MTAKEEPITFTGTVTYVYPTLKPETRTIPVRIELANRGQKLKPNMYADIELAMPARGNMLAAPASAVIDSGAGVMFRLPATKEMA